MFYHHSTFAARRHILVTVTPRGLRVSVQEDVVSVQEDRFTLGWQRGMQFMTMIARSIPPGMEGKAPARFTFFAAAASHC